MTPQELNARVKKYREWIESWTAMLATAPNAEELRLDIRDLETHIGYIIGPREHLNFRPRRRATAKRGT